MAAPLVDRSTGDVIPASDHNDVKDYLEDGTYRINTLSLDVGGTEVITSARYIKPVRIILPVGGLNFYASNGVTVVGSLDESSNFLILGGVGSL